MVSASSGLVPRRNGRDLCPVAKPRLRAPVQEPDKVAVARVACSIKRGALHGAEMHHARRTTMVCGTGAKDDSLDAYVLADSLRTDMHLFR